MIIRPCVDDKVFPFLMIDNFYNEEELELIWEDLTKTVPIIIKETIIIYE